MFAMVINLYKPEKILKSRKDNDCQCGGLKVILAAKVIKRH